MLSETFRSFRNHAINICTQVVKNLGTLDFKDIVLQQDGITPLRIWFFTERYSKNKINEDGCFCQWKMLHFSFSYVFFTLASFSILYLNVGASWEIGYILELHFYAENNSYI